MTRDSKPAETFRAGHVSYIPAENLLISVGMREGGYVHKATPGAGGGGAAVLSPDELACARYLYPQIDGYAENMRTAQVQAELEATRSAAETALALVRREREALDRDIAAAAAAAAPRDEAMSKRERACASRERTADERVRVVSQKLEALRADVRRALPAVLLMAGDSDVELAD
jgi:hypothetical protein